MFPGFFCTFSDAGRSLCFNETLARRSRATKLSDPHRETFPGVNRTVPPEPCVISRISSAVSVKPGSLSAQWQYGKVSRLYATVDLVMEPVRLERMAMNRVQSE
jgi:hypothetical protein